MAKIIIVGDAAVIESSYTLDDIKEVAKYQQEALGLYDETGKEFFRVGVGKNGPGTFNRYGAVFGGTSRDGTGKATITVSLPEGTDNAKQYVEDTYGQALMYLINVEEKLDSAIDLVRQIKESINRAIETP